MVLFSNRRHRLHAHELGPVLKAVRSELGRLVEEKKDLFQAEALFKVLYRFEEYKHGRPSYPDPITWGLIEGWLNLVKGPFIDAEEDLERRSFENLVTFYADELKAVLNGARASATFSQGERLKFRRHGILRFIRAKGPLYEVTARARKVLEAEA